MKKLFVTKMNIEEFLRINIAVIFCLCVLLFGFSSGSYCCTSIMFLFIVTSSYLYFFKKIIYIVTFAAPKYLYKMEKIPVGESDFFTFLKNNYIVIVVAASLVLFAMFIYLIGRCMNSNGDNFVFFNFLLICYDLAFDIAFIIKNGSDVPGLLRPAIIILIVSGSINLLVSFGIILHQRLCNPAFADWLRQNHRFAALIIVFSAANIQALKVLSSKFGGMDIFGARYSTLGKRVIAWTGVLNLGFQDIPQLVVLSIYWAKTDGYMVFPFISLIFNVIILFIDCFGRILDAVVIQNDDDGTTRRVNNRSTDSSIRYSERIGAASE